jgi:hypothetical protein
MLTNDEGQNVVDGRRSFGGVRKGLRVEGSTIWMSEGRATDHDLHNPFVDMFSEFLDVYE